MNSRFMLRARGTFWLALLGLSLFTSCGRGDQLTEIRSPNIIVIFADDQGYADAGVYGAEGYDTPAIDRIAAEGIRFTSFYAVNPACTPSRASLLTGLYAERVGLSEVLFPRSTVGLSPEETTVAELLKTRGYATAAIGKWHLGDHPVFLPTNHGFDTYFGLPYSNDMSPDSLNNPRPNAGIHPPLPLVRDTTVVEREPDQSLLTARYTDEAVRFIEANRSRPFFLYLAHAFPHVPLWASDRFRGTTARGLYGDVIAEIDHSVAEILSTLNHLGLDEDTIIFYTSDNGPWLVMGNHGGSAGPFREGKATTFEGGLLGDNPGVLGKSGLTVGLLSEPVTIAGVTVSNVAAIVNAIKTDDDFRILSTPQIMTTDNEEARITVGENRPYQTRSTTDTSGGTFESFEYRDVGKILKITPHVTEGRLVRLKISLEVTNVDETSTATTSSTLPVTQKRTIDTTVIVKDNHTVAIGGLIDDSMTDNQNQVPGLGDIPVFGWLFKNTKTTAEKTNLYIFLTPKVIKNPAEADKVYKEKQGEIETIQGGGIRLYRGEEE